MWSLKFRAHSWRGKKPVAICSFGLSSLRSQETGTLVTSLNGGSVALMEVVEMAALGRIKILVDRYPLSAAKQAYDDFEHGRLVGRAVLIPEGSEASAA